MKPWFKDEHPKRLVNLPAFWIDKYEVVNRDYRDFLIANNYWVPRSLADNGCLKLPTWIGCSAWRWRPTSSISIPARWARRR